MKKALLILLLAIPVVSMTSCTKYYNCECIDHKGKASLHTVEAKGAIQAAERCKEQGELSNCTLK